MRDDGEASFIRRATPFTGSVNDALRSADRVFEHFSDVEGPKMRMLRLRHRHPPVGHEV